MSAQESVASNRRSTTLLACLGGFILLTVTGIYTGWVGNWTYDQTKHLVTPPPPDEPPENDPFIKGLRDAQVK